jgi:hypothetical protein
MESVDGEIAHLSSSHGISVKELSTTTETSVSLSQLSDLVLTCVPPKNWLAALLHALTYFFGFHMHSLTYCFRL